MSGLINVRAHGMTRRCVALVVLMLVSAAVRSEKTAPDIWSETLRATNYAATAKASFAVGCRAGNPLSLTPQYKVLCPKLRIIPHAVIESAARPYLKRHVSESVARDAVAFWSSPRGSAISKKIVREIETGVHDQLTPDDLQVIERANNSVYGRALSAFAMDREGSVVVARSMLAYEP